MAGKQGAALQQYNNELVKCLDELSRRRRVLQVCLASIGSLSFIILLSVLRILAE